MTMHTESTMSAAAAFQAASIHEEEALAALARKWGVDGVGREYPRHVTRTDGYRYVRAGKWYVVRDGARLSATPAQAAALGRAIITSVGSVGPILAAAAQ